MTVVTENTACGLYVFMGVITMDSTAAAPKKAEETVAQPVIANSTSAPKKSTIELLPQYVLAATGLVYAAGFLVVLNFLDRFGIRDTGADFWKARYMHIGIMCLALPVLLNILILPLGYLIFHGKFKSPTMWQRLLPVGFLAVNLVVVCYTLIMLTNRAPGTKAIAGLVPLLWIVAVTLPGVALLLLIERIIEKVSGRVPSADSELSPTSQSFAVGTRWVLALIVVALDVWYFLDLKSTVTGVQPAFVLVYIGFSVLLVAMVSTVAIYEKRQIEDGRRRAIDALAVSIIGPFFYLVVLAFTYGIFQNIPATRGGGDYTASPRVVLTFKSPQSLAPANMKYFEKGSTQMTVRLILIEETSWAFFLADPEDAGGPSEWKSIGGRKPQIFVVNKSEVAQLQSESRNPTQANP